MRNMIMCYSEHSLSQGYFLFVLEKDVGVALKSPSHKQKEKGQAGPIELWVMQSECQCLCASIILSPILLSVHQQLGEEGKGLLVGALRSWRAGHRAKGKLRAQGFAIAVVFNDDNVHGCICNVQSLFSEDQSTRRAEETVQDS